MCIFLVIKLHFWQQQQRNKSSYRHNILILICKGPIIIIWKANQTWSWVKPFWTPQQLIPGQTAGHSEVKNKHNHTRQSPTGASSLSVPAPLADDRQTPRQEKSAQLQALCRLTGLQVGEARPLGLNEQRLFNLTYFVSLPFVQQQIHTQRQPSALSLWGSDTMPLYHVPVSLFPAAPAQKCIQAPASLGGCVKLCWQTLKQCTNLKASERSFLWQRMIQTEVRRMLHLFF